MQTLQGLIVNYREDQISNIYSQFSQISFNDSDLKELEQTVLPKLFKLFDDGLLRKDLVFLNLLANPCPKLLSQIMDYEIAQPLNLHNGMSLFTHCYYRKKHWFAELLQSQESARSLVKYLDTNLQNDIKIFELIMLTNQNVITIEQLENLLHCTVTTNISDVFISSYVNEIQYVLNIISYCKQKTFATDLNETQLFLAVNQTKLLKFFSDLLPLDDATLWHDVAQKLKEEESRFECNLESDAPRDIDEFNCYLILANIIKSLKLCIRADSSNAAANKEDKISAHINNARNTLDQLNPKLNLQILEDIFTMCFFKWKHWQHSIATPAGISGENFICADKELRLLLHFLRPCIDDLKSRIPIRSHEATQVQELNRHVREALWRLEMLDDLDSFDMSHMLSDSETLIQTSLKKGRFDKAHQVIQIFSLEETCLAREIIYTEKLNDLRVQLQHSFKLQQIQRQMPNINSTSCQDKLPRRILDDFLDKHDSGTLHDLTDVAFIACMSHEDTKEVLDYIKFSHEFHDKATVLLNSIQNTNLQGILTNAEYDLDLDVYRTKLQFYHEVKHTLQKFNNLLNSQSTAGPQGNENNLHLIYKTYSDLKQLAGIKEVNQISYFHRLFNYLKIFLRVFAIEGNNGDLITRGNSVSYFDLLQRCRSDWIGRLLFERKMDPRDFEHLFGKLKIDLLYTTSINCFPQIRLGAKRHSCLDKSYEYQAPTRVVFSYIVKRNWLLAFIMNEIFGLVQMDVNESRTKYFTQYTNTNEIENLKTLFGNNKIVAALHQDYYEKCVDYVNEHLLDDDLGNNGQAVESAEEISEGHLHSKWMHLLMIIDSIPERKFSKETYDLRDKILMNLASDAYDDESYKYVKYMKNYDLRREFILENFMSWPGEFCVSLLKMEVGDEQFSWAEKVQFCEDVKTKFDYESWWIVHHLCVVQPENIYTKLITVPKVSLLLNFDQFYDTKSLLLNIPTHYMAALLNCQEDLNNIRQLLSKLENPIAMCLDLIETVRNLNQLEFLIEYLLQESYNDENFLQNVRVSSKILRNFQMHEREQLWCLINNPLSLIEMLIMNTKLDKLGIVLEDIRGDLENCEFNDSVISIEGIDELLRKYAEKSLDVRIILAPHPSLLKGSEVKLMESLDSMYGPDRKYFEMPLNVPTKSEWIANDKVLECMCCQNTVFSMFNRRHHCRRCGRVICFNCSTKRMHVSTYGDILVRVCLDCYDQSKTDAKSDSTSNKSVVYDYWFLSDRAEHNVIVRQEFSYEHAPSVSLCLSIMKYHTKTHSYPKFLLDQCDVMLKLLQPPAHNAPQEVDYILVIKMLKSLAIAAKMVSSECQLPWGSSQADRILSQADLFALLAERGCLNLLPPSSSGAPYVDGIVLRKLRDKLLMQEQWYFALDVSTKAGLENAGVFAAWGKSCLKAGCLQMAREKFQRCFDKTGHYDSLGASVDDDPVDVSASFRSKYSRPGGPTDNKPIKNPAILEQIIEILESKTYSFTIPSPARKANDKDNSNAILIKAKLRNLKSIANGNLEPRTDFRGCNVDPVYFQECLYYLKKYGSHLGLLQFYLKHHKIMDCLIHIYDNKVTVDIFIEVYIICLRDGKINLLQKAMSRFDSTLEIWKDYLKGICRHLEKQGLLNSLYQLQQYMVDYVRAAMTCIRFYKDNATSYRELSSNIHFLDKAEAHFLQELEQQQWVEVNTVASNISDNSYEEKLALSNPSLVMKMDSRTIEQHIHTVKRQNEITKFLAQREKNDVQLLQLLPYIMPNIEGVSPNRLTTPKQLPTLFDSANEKVQLAVLLIICGDKVQDGYDLAHSIIQDYKLKTLKVYCHAGRQLAREDRYNEIAELVTCIRSKGSNDPAVISVCDEMLTLAVRTLNRNDVPTSQLESLIKLITDRATKISIYIETRQLKSAYLLAAKYNRFGDIRRILREAELINKQDIKKLCQRLLQIHSHSKD